jgi:hypothetical protein
MDDFDDDDEFDEILDIPCWHDDEALCGKCEAIMERKAGRTEYGRRRQAEERSWWGDWDRVKQKARDEQEGKFAEIAASDEACEARYKALAAKQASCPHRDLRLTIVSGFICNDCGLYLMRGRKTDGPNT